MRSELASRSTLPGCDDHVSERSSQAEGLDERMRGERVVG